MDPQQSLNRLDLQDEAVVNEHIQNQCVTEFQSLVRTGTLTNALKETPLNSSS